MREWNLMVYNIDELDKEVQKVIIEDFKADNCCWQIPAFKNILVDDIKKSNKLIDKTNAELVIDFDEDHLPCEIMIQLELWDDKAIDFIKTTLKDTDIAFTDDFYNAISHINIGEYNADMVNIYFSDVEDNDIISDDDVDNVCDVIQEYICNIEDTMLERAIWVSHDMLDDAHIIKFIQNQMWEFTNQGIHTDFINDYVVRRIEK